MNSEILRRISTVSVEEKALLEGNKLNKELYTNEDPFVIDSRRMLDKGKLIDIRPHTRFVDFPAHKHNYIEITYMYSGRTRHVVNGEKVIDLNTGELLMFDQSTYHSIERAEENDIAINFIVLPQFFDYALGLIGSDNILGEFLINNLRNKKDSIGYLHFKVSDIITIQNIMENLIVSLLNHEPNYKQINQITMGLLFLQLLNYTERLDTSRNVAGANLLVLEVLREIEENYKNANLTNIAKRHKVSLAYISKMMRKTTGLSYKELLQEKRLSKSASLLLSTKRSISDIIESVGYTNSSYFFKLFKGRYGVSPREFRQEH